MNTLTLPTPSSRIADTGAGADSSSPASAGSLGGGYQMSTITRRAALRGVVSTAAATAALAVPAASATTADVDAVLNAWRAWRPLEEEDWAINAAWRDIHNKHPRTRETPSVLVFGVQCTNDRDIDDVCSRAAEWMGPVMPQLRESANRELAAVLARAGALEKKTGLTRLQERSEELDGIRGPLFDLIENADGSSPIVVAAKLDCALSHLSADANLDDCGPSGIVSAIRGLLPELPSDMREKLALIAVGEGKIREIYTPRPVASEEAVS